MKGIRSMMTDRFPSDTSSSRGDAQSRTGAVLLVFVLAVAAVGLMFGLCRQLAHRFAVIRRLDRTYQVEKTLATRDALAIANTAVTRTMTGFKYFCYTNASLNVRWDTPANVPWGNDLVVEITSIPDKDRRDMDADEDDDDVPWRTVKNDPDPALSVNFQGGLASFSAPLSTNFEYVAAIAKRTKECWQDCEFGFLYRLDMHEGRAEYNLGSLNLYLVGVSGTDWDGDYTDSIFDSNDSYRDYAKMLRECNWYKMELVGGGQDGTEAHRNLKIHSVADGTPTDAYETYHFLKGIKTGTVEQDAFDHGGGFLLSSTAFCGFGENAEEGMLFSRRDDLTSPNVSIRNTDGFLKSFENGVIVIEHVFPTNSPPNNLSNREVTIDSFVMREPATYSVSVCNRALAGKSYEGKVTTWIFQTQKPAKEIVGRQCVLDTFGQEPASYFGERRGIIPQ